jgi:hypothetical protein
MRVTIVGMHMKWRSGVNESVAEKVRALYICLQIAGYILCMCIAHRCTINALCTTTYAFIYTTYPAGACNTVSGMIQNDDGIE